MVGREGKKGQTSDLHPQGCPPGPTWSMLITSEKGPASQGGWPWPRCQVLAQLSFSFSFSVLPWQYFKVQILIVSKAIKMGRVPGRCLAWTPVGSQGAGMASGSLCASSSPSWGPNIWTEKMLGRWRPLFCPANSCDPFLQFPLLSIACVGAHVAWSRSLR